MFRPTSRDRTAAAFYAVLAVLAMGAAIAMANVILIGVSIVLVIAFLGALHRYPIDRYW